MFSHGLGGSRNGYQYLGRYWANHGYASLHVQHIGSDNSLWRGNPFGLTMRLTSAAQDSEAIARAKDVSFALTELLAMPSMTAPRCSKSPHASRMPHACAVQPGVSSLG